MEIGHSVDDAAFVYQAVEKGDNPALQNSVAWRGRRAHNHVTVTVGFDAAFDPGQVGIPDEFGPPAEVEFRLHRL